MEAGGGKMCSSCGVISQVSWPLEAFGWTVGDVGGEWTT